MKKKLLFLLLLLSPAANSFAQGNWSPWVSITCFKGFQGSFKKLGYVKTINQYSYQARIKNNYRQKVTFDMDWIVAGEKINIGQVTLKPSEVYEHTSRYFNHDASVMRLEVNNVSFSDKPNCYASCDNGTPNQPNCDTKTNTGLNHLKGNKTINSAPSGNISGNQKSTTTPNIEEIKNAILSNLRDNTKNVIARYSDKTCEVKDFKFDIDQNILTIHYTTYLKYEYPYGDGGNYNYYYSPVTTVRTIDLTKNISVSIYDISKEFGGPLLYFSGDKVEANRTQKIQTATGKILADTDSPEISAMLRELTQFKGYDFGVDNQNLTDLKNSIKLMQNINGNNLKSTINIQSAKKQKQVDAVVISNKPPHVSTVNKPLTAGQVKAEIEDADKYYGADTDDGYANAMILYLKNKDLLNATQINNLGFCYWKVKDYQPALRFFELSASKGNETAKFNSGFNYFNGTGADVDYQKAYNYLIRIGAPYNQDMETYHMIAHCLEHGADLHGTLGQPNYQAAKAYFLLAAEKGHVDSMVHLADYYNNSGKIAANYTEARKWYEKACEKGNADACNALAKLK